MPIPDFSVLDHVLAGVAAFGAGAVNAIAGGGTLISFPTLVALGAPAVNANVTNTVALCPGYYSGAVAQRSQLVGERPRVVPLAVAAAFGGLTGSALLLASGEAVFKNLVPWLILAACALLGGQNWLKSRLRLGARGTSASIQAQVVGAYAMSIYGGYFGAGLGIALLAVLGLMLPDGLTKINAIKQVLSTAINVVAAGFFLGSGKVLWSIAAVMAPLSLVGGYAGGSLVRFIKPTLLRPAIVVYGTALAFWYLLR